MFNLRPATRKITAALGAAALALGAMTATAIPARANGDDIAKILAGTAALVIIGSALSNANAGQGQRPIYPDHPVQPVRPVHPQPGWHHGWQPPRPPQWTPPRPILPGVCAISIEGSRNTYYSGSCLRNSGFRYQLPQRCARDMRTPRGVRTVFEAQCLHNAGFEPGRHGVPRPYPPVYRPYPEHRHPQDHR